MNITKTTQAIVTEGLRVSGLSKKELAAKLGVNPGWITKFYDGTLKTLSDKHADAIEKALNVRFKRIVSKQDGIPGIAIELGKAMNDRPELAQIVSGLLALAEQKMVFSIPFMTPKELIKIGGEITRVVAEWDEADDPHYAKIGLESIKIISAVMARKSNSEAQ